MSIRTDFHISKTIDDVHYVAQYYAEMGSWRVQAYHNRKEIGGAHVYDDCADGSWQLRAHEALAQGVKKIQTQIHMDAVRAEIARKESAERELAMAETIPEWGMF